MSQEQTSSLHSSSREDEPKANIIEHLDLAHQNAPKSGASGLRGLFQSPRVLGITCLATLGGFLFGYDQGVVGNVLVLESFGEQFPSIYMDAGKKGWFVSTLLLGAWLGSLINGPFANRVGRRYNIMFNVVVFLLGSALQTAAMNEAYLFVGRFIAGLSVGAMTHVVPMYIAEISSPNIRGSLVALQQLAITLGILFSYWIAYGTSHIGSTRCAPDIPYTGPLQNGRRTFDAYRDVPASGGCPGQSRAAWRIPVGLQIAPALVLGVGMIFLPFSPRWLIEKGRDEEAVATLVRLRHAPADSPEVIAEVLQIKAEVYIAREIRANTLNGRTGIRAAVQPYLELVSSRPKFHRLAIGCLVMFYQQFVGCNAIIYYAPTIFSQLGLDPNTTSLLATGVYGIVNTVFTLPAVLFLDTVGRRPLLMIGAVGCGFSLVIVGSLVASFGGNWQTHKTAGNAAIAFVYIYDVFFSFSWAPIGWVLPSEIFPLSIRSTGISITTSCTWMSNFIIGVVSPLMLENLAHGGTYFFFAAFALLGFLTTFFFIPETCRKSLEETNALFGDVSSEADQEIARRIFAELGFEQSNVKAIV